jgi:hypothetical protein
LGRATRLARSPLRDISRGFTRQNHSSQRWQSCAKSRVKLLVVCVLASTTTSRTRGYSGGRKNVSAVRKESLFIR